MGHPTIQETGQDGRHRSFVRSLRFGLPSVEEYPPPGAVAPDQLSDRQFSEVPEPYRTKAKQGDHQAIAEDQRPLQIGPPTFLCSLHQADADLDDSRRINDAVGFGSRSLLLLELPNDFLKPIVVA